MDNALWLKIRDYDLDAGADNYNFSTRLAHEQQWPIAFTEQAILEYKKFMYLAATSFTMVSPAPIVDEVWHLHLLFSASYQDFCTLLGKQVQHVPSTHDPKEADKFRQAAAQTRRLYMETFGPVPAAIWNVHCIYDTLHCPQAKATNTGLLKLCGLLGLVLLLPIAYQVLAPWYITIDNPYFLWGFAFIALLVFVLMEINNRKQLQAMVLRAAPDACIHQLQAPELVYLQSGILPLAVNGTINELLEKGALRVTNLLDLNPTDKQVVTEGCGKAVLGVMQQEGTLFYRDLVQKMAQHPKFRNIQVAMDALLRHYHQSKAFRNLYIQNITVFVLLLTAGLVRLATGLMRDKPVFFLVLCLVALVWVIVLRLNKLPGMLAQQILPQLYKQKYGAVSPANMSPDWRYFLLGSVALNSFFGLAVLSSLEGWSRDRWRTPLDGKHNIRESNAGSGCAGDGGSSGCGGGCGGGGCGGCGSGS